MNGNPRYKTDFNGNQTSFIFDLSRNLETSRTEALSTAEERTIATTWHSVYRLPLTITEPNRITSFTYDAAGNVLTQTLTDTTVTPNVSRTWTYTYNAIGQVLTADGPRSDVTDTTTYTYHSCSSGYNCGQLQTVTDALGHVTTFNTYNAHGQPLTITDPNSVVTTFIYDARARLTSTQTSNEQTAYSYWPTGLVKRITLPDLSYIEFVYDDAHRLIQISDGTGNHIDYTLDAMGNRTAENAYDPSSVLFRTRTKVYDTLNRLQKTIAAAGTPDVTTTYAYDAVGNMTGVAAPLSRNQTRLYDALNRLEQVTEPGSAVTRFDYDANDNLAAVTDPRGLVTGYLYNGFGELIEQTSPDSGSDSRTYDAAGNVKTRTDARDITRIYTYDALNRVTSVSAPDQAVSFSYDAGVNGVGRLTGASDATHSMSWVYDGLGRATAKTQTVGGLARSVAYAYHEGRLASITTPSGQLITYEYSQGRIDQVAVNGVAIVSDAIYEPFGPIREWTWGNGTLAIRTYDQDAKITQLDSGGELYDYFYNNAFDLTGIRNNSNNDYSSTLTYDNRARLTTSYSAGRGDSWEHDDNGNWYRQREFGTPTILYEISTTSNRFVQRHGTNATPFAYDDAGNLISDSDAGRPVSLAGVTTATYTYSAIQERIRKVVGGVSTYFVYDERGHLLGEYGSGGALIQETVWMGDIPIATVRPKVGGGVQIFYVHTDHLNTPRKVTRPADNMLVWRWDAVGFGQVLPEQNPAGAGTFRYNLRFPGQYFDAESGLHYNYYRDYDPHTGRYLEPDPIGMAGGINPYAYALVNPVAYVDPFGLSACTDFIDALTTLWALSSSSMAMGREMINRRNTTLSTSDGFKNELVAGGQGGAVSRHIYGHAGSVLAAPFGPGAGVSYAHQAIDYFQRFDKGRNQAETDAEIADDRAARRVAETLDEAMQKRVNAEKQTGGCIDTTNMSDDLKKQLEAILCTP